MLRPFSLLGDGFAWYSMDGSFKLLRQIAHVSAHISQDHIATAFHFLISNLFAGTDDDALSDFLDDDLALLVPDIVTSPSASAADGLMSGQGIAVVELILGASVAIVRTSGWWVLGIMMDSERGR